MRLTASTLAAALLAAAGLFTTLPGWAQTAKPATAAPAARLVPAGSEIAFTTRQMGVPVEGRFGSYTASIALDPKKPETGSVSLSIDTASARFGSAELDAEVGKPVWLAAAKFPQAVFQSKAIKALGGGRYEVAGTLTIKGRAKDLVVPVTLAASGANQVASGSFTIRRLDFAVGEGEWTDTSILANDVGVKFRLVLAGLPQP